MEKEKKSYLRVLQEIAENSANSSSKFIQAGLVNTMNKYNIGMIAFLQNGNNSNFDVPRAYLTMDADSYCYDTDTEPYYTREIIAVVNIDDEICVIPDTDNVPSELFNEFDEWTHFTKEDTENLLKYNQNLLYYFIEGVGILNPHDTMLQVLDSCIYALENIKAPLSKTINVTEY